MNIWLVLCWEWLVDVWINHLMHFGKSFLPWLNVFSAVWKSIESKNGFFEDQTAAETKDLERPVHPAVRLLNRFYDICVCLWLCLCMESRTVVLYKCVCVCFLLVLQNLTSLHWTLAVYTGNCSPCPNLPLPARVTHHWTCLAAGALFAVSAMLALTMVIAYKLAPTAKVKSYQVKLSKQQLTVGPNFLCSATFSQSDTTNNACLHSMCQRGWKFSPPRTNLEKK